MGLRNNSLVNFRGSILGNLITLVLLIGGGLLPVVLLTGSHAIERLSASMIERSLSQCADADGWSQADARGWWELHAQAIRGTRAYPNRPPMPCSR